VGTLKSLAAYGLKNNMRSYRWWQEGIGGNKMTVGELFDAVYSELCEKYPIEYVLKNELLRYLNLTYPDNYTRTEFWVRGGRADVVSIGKDSAVFEIKTRYDSVTRLRDQLSAYSKLFERIIIIANEGHALKFLNLTPRHIGVWSFNNEGACKRYRPAKAHTDDLRNKAILERMYKSQQIALVKDLAPWEKYVASNYYHLGRRLTSDLPPDEMSRIFQKYMQKETRPKRQLQFVDKFPSSLTAALYSYIFTESECRSLMKEFGNRIT